MATLNVNLQHMSSLIETNGSISTLEIRHMLMHLTESEPWLVELILERFKSALFKISIFLSLSLWEFEMDL